jgi:eukaryotic-like serine/threonine-protein kinase
MKRIQTLGGLAVFDGSRPLGGNAQQPRRLALLAVLARAGDRGVSRDRLAGLLWGDIEEDRARRNLNQALYAIRQDLGSEEAILGTRDLRLNPELVEVDVVAFEAAGASGALEQAARLYAGPFLGDFHLAGVRDFARWAEDERARLAAEYRGILEAVAAGAARSGDSAGAVLWWRRLAALDPADAGAAQGLMRALAAVGDTPGALRHAEIFAAVRQEELELPPDPEVQALAEKIRRGELSPAPATPAPVLPAPVLPSQAPAVPEEAGPGPVARAPKSLVRLTPDRARSRRRWAAAALAVVAAAALAGGVLHWRSQTPPALRPSVVAVAPFDVYDPSLQLWHEGLVDLLSRNLDGAGALSTVPPTVVVRHWAGRADSPSAAELGRRTGAGLAVYGSLLSSGPDSVRLRATLFDVAAGRALGEWEGVDALDRMDRLTDSLTVHLLDGLGRTRPIGAVRLAGFRGSSLPVLKAFLQGEQHFRRSEWDSALTYYQRAIDLDGTFAPALRRASSTLGWRNRTHSPQVLEYASRAGANNHGWPPRDSLLIAVESEFFSLMASSMVRGVDPTWMSRIHHLFATSEQATDRYPDDPEAWHDLGEAYNHFGEFVGGTYEQQLQAFDRAIALDSAFSPSYIHPIEVSSAFGADAMRRYLRPYLALLQGDPGAEGARLVARLLDSAQGVADPATLFRDVSDQGLLIATFALSRLPDSAERMVDLARVVASRRGRPAMPGMPAMMDDANASKRQLARALMSRGHLQAGLELLRGQEQTLAFAEAALLGAVPVEQAAAVFRDRAPDPFSPSFVARFPWWASRSDTASLRRASAWSDSVARSDPDPNVRGVSSYVAASAAAFGALARQDTTAALERLASLPDGGCPSCYLDRLTLAQLLVERRRNAEAWRILQAEEPSGAVVPLPTEVLWVLLRGRVGERVGERDRAIQAYAWVAGMWRNADPVLQPYVREARDGLARLTGEKR